MGLMSKQPNNPKIKKNLNELSQNLKANLQRRKKVKKQAEGLEKNSAKNKE
jgi:hypothetical protein